VLDRKAYPSKEELVELFRYEEGEIYWRIGLSYRGKKGDRAGWVGRLGYRKVGIRGSQYLVHRIVFVMHHGYLPVIVDHINGDASDNRIENLREASPLTNTWNRGVSKTNKTGFTGVAWNREKKKYDARILVAGKPHRLGLYRTAEEASAAYQAAALKFRGAYSRTSER